MSIAAIITEGIGPDGSVKYILTLGFDIGTAAPPVVVTPTAQKRPGPAPGSYGPKKYFLPPGWKKKKPSIEEVKTLYVEARKEIPPKEQRGLLPVRFRLEGTSTARLPPARIVDFEHLRGDLEALRTLFEALGRHADHQAHAESEAQESEAQRIKKRKREEEILIYLLLDIL